MIDARGEVAGEVVVVRGDDERAAGGGELAQRLAELAAARRIERRGRLVHQQQRRIHGHGPRDRHALRLAAGELARQRVAAVRDAERLEQLERAPLGVGAGARARRAPARA